MRGISGYGVLTSPDGVKETDTFTCFHCQRIVGVKPFQRDFTRCALCDELICDKCKSLMRCDPFEEKLKSMEARGAALRSYGL